MSATTNEVAGEVWLSPVQAAVKAGRSEASVLRWIRAGVLPAERDPLSRRLRVRLADLDAVLATVQVAPAPVGG